MKVTPAFKKAIDDHLKRIAETDHLFAETLKKPKKNIDDCITYILNEVKKTGQNAFVDEEIYAMAVHYYDEDDINIGKPVTGKVTVNQSDKAKEKQKKTVAPKTSTPIVTAPAAATKPATKKQKSLMDQIPLFD